VRTSDFDYELPDELIAQNPVVPRDSSRLMIVNRRAGTVEHSVITDLPSHLSAGDLLVVNDSRVMAARLPGRREGTGGHVEALLVRPRDELVWEVLFRPAKRAVPDRRFVFEASDGPLQARVVARDGEMVVLEFERAFDPGRVGRIPLPPYVTAFKGNPGQYQTIFARIPASAAAPTAGLHFTPGLVAALEAANVGRTEITLEVGPGTFRPVTADNPREHRMHAERFSIEPAAARLLQGTLDGGRRVVAVGTTVVRTLEHVCRRHGRIAAGAGETDLFILPGDRFRVTGALLTNFHLPRSTLLMLVSAFGGRELILSAYREAVTHRYRFFSFGDAMLII